MSFFSRNTQQAPLFLASPHERNANLLNEQNHDHQLPTLPTRFPATAQDLIRRLLTPNATYRLGNLSGGIQDIMLHPMFNEVGFDWRELYHKRMIPPHKPKVRVVFFFFWWAWCWWRRLLVKVHEKSQQHRRSNLPGLRSKHPTGEGTVHWKTNCFFSLNAAESVCWPTDRTTERAATKRHEF